MPFFGTRRALQVTSADVTRYRVQRLEAGAAPATVNRELAALKRAFSLSCHGERLSRMPHIDMVEEDNVRKGFVEVEQLEAIRHHLPEHARAPVLFAFLTGWRLKSEVLPLAWSGVDFRSGTITLDPGSTKNRRDLLSNGRLADVILFGSFLAWAILDYRAARKRDRDQGATYRAEGIVRDVAVVAIGLAAWAAFAMVLHGPLIGVRPVG